MADEVRLIYATAPDAATADRIAEALVAERLAACVNILAPIRSVYRWRSAVARDDEVAFLVKTSAASAAAAVARLVALHPYDTPAAVALTADAAASSAPFLRWIVEETRVDDGSGPPAALTSP